MLLAISAPLQAVTIGFGCITTNDPTGASCAIAENQMTLELIDATDASGLIGLAGFARRKNR